MFTYRSVMIIQIFSVALLCVESAYVFHRWKTRQHGFLFLHAFSTLVNNLGYLLEISAKSSEAAMTGTIFCYLGKVLIPLSFCTYAISYCRGRTHKRLLEILTFLHSLIFALVLTSRHQTLYYTGWHFTESGLFPHNDFGHGIFYYFYMGMVLIEGAYTLYVLMQTFAHEKSKRRRTVELYLILSIVVSACLYIIFLLDLTNGYDVTALAYTIATVMMYIAIFRHDLMDTLDLAKNYALDNLSEGVIAVDEGGNVLYCNRPAQGIMKELGEEDAQSIVSRLKQLISAGEYLISPSHVWKPEERHLNLHGKERGCLYVFMDITDNYRYSERLAEEVAAKTERISLMQNSVITGMATMVESRDNSTGGHIRRTSDCVRLFTRHLMDQGCCPDIPQAFFDNVVKAAPMHDLGKIAVDDAVLRKPGRFTEEEFDKMKRHTCEGARIVGEVLRDTDDDAFRTIAVNVAHYHHEKWNGTGYPEHLSGEQIPFEARIMALADVFDALVSKRCYKESYSYDRAFAIIGESLGSHFDPALGARFMELRPGLEKLYDAFAAQDDGAKETVSETSDHYHAHC